MSEILIGNCLDVLPTLEEQSVQTCITSPPYWGLRNYQMGEQLGLESTPEEYVANMVQVFREVHRVLRDDGTLWLNLGDSYMGGGGGNYNKSGISQAGGQHLTNVRNKRAFIENTGLKSKDLVGIPWRVAFALQADGWYLRQDIIWHKPNPMPESVTDRCTKSHEYIFLLSKNKKYYYDHEAIKEPVSLHSDFGRQIPETPMPSCVGDGVNNAATRKRLGNGSVGDASGRNKRSVWTVTTKPYKGAHFATFPPDLIEPCILAGCPKGGIVLDPFAGAGTTGLVAKRFGCGFVGIELNPEYAEMARTRIENEQDVLFN
jgi:DNA modification methylase